MNIKIYKQNFSFDFFNKKAIGTAAILDFDIKYF